MKGWERHFWWLFGIIAVTALAWLWIASFRASDAIPQVKAGVIAAASAVTVAIFAFTGSFLTTWRSQTLTMRATVATERRSAYSKFLAAAERYLDAGAALKASEEHMNVALSEIKRISETDPSGELAPDDIDTKLTAAESEFKGLTEVYSKRQADLETALTALIDAKAGAELLATEPTLKAIAAYLKAVRADEASERNARDAFRSAAQKELLGF